MYRGDWMVELARTYQEARIREGHRDRLLAQARLGKPAGGILARILFSSGDALISLGRWLKQRAQPSFDAAMMLHAVRLDEAPCEQ